MSVIPRSVLEVPITLLLLAGLALVATAHWALRRTQ